MAAVVRQIIESLVGCVARHVAQSLYVTLVSTLAYHYWERTTMVGLSVLSVTVTALNQWTRNRLRI